jgi:hypothetical protein
LGVIIFSPLVDFWSIFSVTDVPRGELHSVIGHHKQWGPPVETMSKPFLKCLDTKLLTLLNFSCLTIFYLLEMDLLSI